MTPARLLWSRALPGTVAVVAALALPEFSVDAGDLPAARAGAAAATAPRVTIPLVAAAEPAPFAARPAEASLAGGREVTIAAPASLASPAPIDLVASPPSALVRPGTAAASPIAPAAPLAAAADIPPVGRAQPPYAPAAPDGEIALGFFTASLAVPAMPLGPVELAVPPLPPGTTVSSPVPAAAASGPARDPAALIEAGSLVPAVAGIAPSAAAAETGVREDAGASAGREPITGAAQAKPLSAPASASLAPMPAPVPASVSGRARDAAPIPAAASVPATAPAKVAPAAVPRPAPAAAPRASVGSALRPAFPAASAPASPRASVPALAGIPRAKPQPGLAGAGAQAGYGLDIKSQLLTRIDGKAAGQLDFRQTPSGLSVRLGSLAEVLGERLDPAMQARIRASSSGNVYLSLAQLKAQGIPISYDPVYDEFNIGMLDTRPKAAGKVHMEQISTPERGIGSVNVGQVPRRR